MKSRRHVTLEENAELNLVPYMDIMVNLIMFLLFTMSGFVQMKIINVSMPAIDPADDMAGTPPPDRPKLAVVLGIVNKSGFLISLNGEFVPGPDPEKPTIPTSPNGTYDFDKLTEKMAEVKKKEPTLTALTIVPDVAVDYKTLVDTMDAIRLDKSGKLLFPDVLLGVQ